VQEELIFSWKIRKDFVEKMQNMQIWRTCLGKDQVLKILESFPAMLINVDGISSLHKFVLYITA